MFQVFIENEAGSTTKHRHVEKTLELIGAETVSRPYPFAYGFIIGTTSGDGDNLDCYVMTDRHLTTGEIVDCEAVALLEQHEDGDEDHNVLAVPGDDQGSLTEDAEPVLRDFIAHVFDHVPGKVISTGRLLARSDAENLVALWSD
jgi:inorganic pyrophosphatase